MRLSLYLTELPTLQPRERIHIGGHNHIPYTQEGKGRLLNKTAITFQATLKTCQTAVTNIKAIFQTPFVKSTRSGVTELVSFFVPFVGLLVPERLLPFPNENLNF